MGGDMHDTGDEPRLQEEEPTSREPLQNKMNGSDAIQSSKEVNNEDGGDDPKEDTTLLRSSLQSDGSKQRSSKKIQWTPQILVEEEEKQQDLDAGMNNGDINNDYKVQKSVEFSTEFSNINEKDYSNERKAEAALKDRQRRKRIIERKAKLERVQERKRRESESQFNYSRSNFPIREWKFMLPFGIQHPVVINPLVTGMAVTSLWGLVIWGGGTFDCVIGCCAGMCAMCLD
jgi:hypothetical protein